MKLLLCIALAVLAGCGGQDRPLNERGRHSVFEKDGTMVEVVEVGRLGKFSRLKVVQVSGKWAGLPPDLPLLVSTTSINWIIVK